MIDVSEPTWSDGRVGPDARRRHAGMFVKVERDSSGAGLHIWLSERHPDDGPSRGWGIWTDSAEQVDEWFVEELHERGMAATARRKLRPQKVSSSGTSRLPGSTPCSHTRSSPKLER